MLEANLAASSETVPVSPPNFVFPIRDLESERVKLTVFVPAIYAQEYVEQTKGHPELFKYFPGGPFDTVEEFDTFLERWIRPDSGAVLFAIFDKTGDSERLAGMVGLVNTEPANQSTEIGAITVFPEFQRTHVTSNAVGLLLHYCLELPSHLTSSNSTSESESESDKKYGPGLGLRRVQWQTHMENEASARTAERLGFRREGIIRWQRILPEGKYGMAVTKERGQLCRNPGRHTWMLSLCWDDWEVEGVRELVRRQMDRTGR